MRKDNIFPEKNNGFQALPGADFLPWPYSAAEKNDYFCDHKIESTMIRQYAGLVKFAHTIFAMPFALIGFVYALRTEGIPSDCAGRYARYALVQSEKGNGCHRALLHGRSAKRAVCCI